MRHRPAIGLIWLSLVALLLAMLPASASAKPPIRFTDVATGIDCFAETGDGFLILSLTTSSEQGYFIDLAFWETPASPETDAPTYVMTDGVVSGDITGLQAVIQVAEFDPDTDPPFGDALDPVIVDVDFEALGEPITFDDTYRDGNRRIRESGTVQFLQPSGTVTLPGADLTDLSSCGAAHQEVTFWGTDPSGFNVRFAEFSVSCQWEDESGFVDLYISRDEIGAFGDLFGFDGQREFGGGTGDGTLTTTGVSLPEFVLTDIDSGDEIGTASASASLTELSEAIRIVEVSGRDRTKIVATLFSVDGSLDVTIDGTTVSYPMDDEHCSAADSRVRVHEVRPAGPPPKRFANDTPDTAAPLRLGRAVRLTTGLGAVEPEAPCILIDDVEVPFGHTAWWSIAGTGREMTADTAGSVIDTVIGIYVREGDALVQVACVDDVFDEDGGGSFQAAVTWDSVAGQTYLIQVGGFGGGSGQLRLVVR
jgi:hypothetical protein